MSDKKAETKTEDKKATKEEKKPKEEKSAEKTESKEKKVEKTEDQKKDRKNTADTAKEKAVPSKPSKKKDDNDAAPKADSKGAQSSATPSADDTLVPYPKKASPFWRVEPDACVDIRVAAKGVAALKPTTVMASFAVAVEKQSDNMAMRVERDGKWQEWTWKQYYSDVERFGKSLLSLDFAPHSAVNIIGFNSPEWFIANMGAIAAGGKAAGIYTTNQTDACQYIVEHSEASVVVVEDQKQLDKFMPIRAELTNVKAYVLYTGKKPEGINDKKKKGGVVYDWEEFMKLGDDVKPKQLQKRIDAQKPGHVCTLIYTSGTTGNPKAVMITHDNATWTPQTVFCALGDDFGTVEELNVSYLPLSHVAAQMLDIHMPIAVCATRGGKCSVTFARPDALKGTLKDTLVATRPTLLFGVPRVWEKMGDAIKAIGAKNTGIKAMLGKWAKGKAEAMYLNKQIGHSGSEPFMAGMAAKLLAKVKLALGLDRCRFMMTGAAPISQDTLRYFGSLNMPIYELYGMSESTGPHTLSYPGFYLLGSCGPVLPGCELKIDHDPTRDAKEEGEILFRGRHIMMGYMKNEEKTREAIDPDGWLHSGDVGKLDKFGFLHITGRIKELIITAGGENVAPVPMEAAVKSTLPGIANIMMVGDKRKYNVCLITLNCEPDDDGGFTEKLTGASLTIGSPATTTKEAQACDIWQKYITEGITRVNKEVAVSNASKIQKFHICDSDFSVPAGDLTPTLKLKRPVVEKKYAKEKKEEKKEKKEAVKDEKKKPEPESKADESDDEKEEEKSKEKEEEKSEQEDDDEDDEKKSE